jgi:hypothetical protein
MCAIALLKEKHLLSVAGSKLFKNISAYKKSTDSTDDNLMP